MLKKIEISHRTILFTLVVLGLIWFVLQIREILLLLFIAFIITSGLKPLADFLERKRLPRFIAIFLLYIVVFGFLGVSLAGTIPSLIIQSTKLFQALPLFIEKVLPYWNIDMNSFSQQIAPIGENLLKLTVGIFSNIITTFAVIVFSFYFLLERKNLDKILEGFIGKEGADETMTVVRNIEQRLGAWVIGELLLMLFIGILVYVGLLILKIDYALPLAILAGLLEIIPNIGPVLSSIPAIIIGLATSPILALSVGVVYLITQQIENNLLVPLVMKKSVGLSPVITIISMLVGGKLMGISGVILAVPTVLVIQELLHFYIEKIRK